MSKANQSENKRSTQLNRTEILRTVVAHAESMGLRDREKIESLPRNIGGGGLGVCLTEKLQPGTILRLEITVPDDPEKAILGEGEVLWNKRIGLIATEQNVTLYETGVKFVDIDPVAIGRVYTYQRQKKPR